jgi:hypothetical protein
MRLAAYGVRLERPLPLNLPPPGGRENLPPPGGRETIDPMNRDNRLITASTTSTTSTTSTASTASTAFLSDPLCILQNNLFPDDHEQIPLAL